MQNFANTVLWIYIVLLLVGGLIGFLKGKSKISLVTSVIAAVLLILTTLRGIFQPVFAIEMVNVILIVLLVVFAARLIKTKKFMPGGMMLLATIVVLALRNLARS